MLTALRIRNYRSLIDIRFGDLQQFNVLIGRNNVGKSSVLNSLQAFAQAIQGGGAVFDRSVWPWDEQRRIDFELSYSPAHQLRSAFLDRLQRQGAIDQGRANLLMDSQLLREVRYVFRSSNTNPAFLLLHELHITAEDGNFTQVQRLDPATPANVTNPVSSFVDIEAAARADVRLPLDAQRLSLGGGHVHQENIAPSLAGFGRPNQQRTATWPISWLVDYFADAFFFSPFRHSSPSLPALEAQRLAQDGSNLPQVLHTISNNDDRLFDRIRGFMAAALPDLGRLQTPLDGSDTYSAFRSSSKDYLTRLIYMGGGIEQLLMIAVVLLTTPATGPVFIEEPETHLHPGAQRYLIDRLLQDGRQAVLTTHSPTFLNLSFPKSVYRLSIEGGATTSLRAESADDLSEALSDIGARNSDILLSDAVVFVEGQSDSDVYLTLSSTVGVDWTERNINVVSMRGSDHAKAAAPLASATLEGISQHAAVPHVFILDRDERSQQERQRLTDRLAGRVEYLERRELENYLIHFDAVRAALLQKYATSPDQRRAVEALTESAFDETVNNARDQQYGQILVKRIRRSLGSLPGGWIARESVGDIESMMSHADFPAEVAQWVRARLTEALSALDIESHVKAAAASFDEEWKDEKRRAYLAPGTEVLDAVFRSIGGKYSKPTDAALIARHLPSGAIPEDLSALLKRVADLAPR